MDGKRSPGFNSPISISRNNELMSCWYFGNLLSAFLAENEINDLTISLPELHGLP
jgi:hypothetical protein